MTDLVKDGFVKPVNNAGIVCETGFVLIAVGLVVRMVIEKFTVWVGGPGCR